MPARGSYRKGIQKRAEILDAALRIIARDGYSKTTIGQLAQEVGLSPNGVLHHFGSKEALLAAVVQERDARHGAASAEDDGLGHTRGYVEFVRRNTDQPGLIQLFTRIVNEATEPEHDAHEYFRDRYRVARDSWETYFAGVAAEGRLREGLEPRVAAETIVAVSDGLQTQWLYDRDVDMPRAIASVLALMVKDA